MSLCVVACKHAHEVKLHEMIIHAVYCLEHLILNVQGKKNSAEASKQP